jgi:signal transduction histidine kinase
MKTPLMAIGGFTTQVLRCISPDDPKYRKLEMAVKQTARLEAMVRELLEFGKPLELNRCRVDLNEISREALALSQPLAKQKRVNLKMDLYPSAPELMLDSQRILKVVVNLITNAVQVSPEGEDVCVRTRSNNGAVFLEVSDRGSGIKEKDKGMVFQPFFSTKEDGTGLGLAISKKIIERHGGKIGFYQNSPKGTTFSLCFEL